MFGWPRGLCVIRAEQRPGWPRTVTSRRLIGFCSDSSALGRMGARSLSGAKEELERLARIDGAYLQSDQWPSAAVVVRALEAFIESFILKTFFISIGLSGPFVWEWTLIDSKSFGTAGLFGLAKLQKRLNRYSKLLLASNSCAQTARSKPIPEFARDALQKALFRRTVDHTMKMISNFFRA